MNEKKDGLTESAKYTESGQYSTNAPGQESKSLSGKALEVIKMGETPFNVVRTERGSFIAIGNKRITELEDEEELTAKITSRDWNLIVSLITVITEAILDEKGREATKWFEDNKGRMKGPIYGSYKVGNEIFHNPNNMNIDEVIKSNEEEKPYTETDPHKDTLKK